MHAIAIEVDEACSGDEAYRMGIRFSDSYFHFIIPHPNTVKEIADLMSSSFEQTKGKEIIVGQIGKSEVEFARGSKCDKSWKIRIRSRDGLLGIHEEQFGDSTGRIGSV